MKLIELKELIDFQVAHHPEANEWDVVIPNNRPSVGPRACTHVTQVGGGIDWDKGKFFIFPEDKMYTFNDMNARPPITFNNSNNNNGI